MIASTVHDGEGYSVTVTTTVDESHTDALVTTLRVMKAARELCASKDELERVVAYEGFPPLRYAPRSPPPGNA